MYESHDAVITSSASKATTSSSRPAYFFFSMFVSSFPVKIETRKDRPAKKSSPPSGPLSNLFLFPQKGRIIPPCRAVPCRAVPSKRSPCGTCCQPPFVHNRIAWYLAPRKEKNQESAAAPHESSLCCRGNINRRAGTAFRSGACVQSSTRLAMSTNRPSLV